MTNAPKKVNIPLLALIWLIFTVGFPRYDNEIALWVFYGLLILGTIISFIYGLRQPSGITEKDYVSIVICIILAIVKFFLIKHQLSGKPWIIG